MFLRSLTIKNYRSLEDVKLDKLGRFNVLIGRNNSGKSSVFGALQLVNGVVKNVTADSQRVLTDLDEARSLEIRLTFEPRLQDREEFLDLLYTTPDLRPRREEEKNSPFMSQVEYLLKAPAGLPEYLQPYEIRVLADDNQWAVVQRVVNPEAHTAVRVAVRGKSDQEAVLYVIDALTLLRGIWNLFLNLRRPAPPFWPSVPREPVNKILLGPAHTVHEPDGTLSSATMWFETSYQRPVKPYNVQKLWIELKDFEGKVRKRLQRARYPKDLEKPIRRYTEALDLTDWNATFVQLWSLLEYLTDSYAQFDKTIK